MKTYIYFKNGKSVIIEPEMIKEVTTAIEKDERFMIIINKSDETVAWIILSEVSFIVME